MKDNLSGQQKTRHMRKDLSRQVTYSCLPGGVRAPGHRAAFWAHLWGSAGGWPWGLQRTEVGACTNPSTRDLPA